LKFEPNYKRPFSQFVKKQHKPFQAVIEDEVLAVCVDPSIGEEKVGDLARIFVHKFKYKKQEYLMDYVPDVSATKAEGHKGPQFLLIDFYQIGSHENFYADLKAYLKADGWYK
jgi:hypothetical protein